MKFLKVKYGFDTSTWISLVVLSIYHEILRYQDRNLSKMMDSELLKLILYIIFKLIVTRIGDLIVDFNLPMGVILY